MGWTHDEKLELEKTVQKLQNKLKETENELETTATQLKESREQHEDLEFQLLELQEVHDKVTMKSCIVMGFCAFDYSEQLINELTQI